MGRTVAIASILAILVLGLLIPSCPAPTRIPHRDSGVFLYTGWRILSGEIPYRDVWDHKPPAIHYIDALGLFVGGGSTWGVWLLELIALGTAAVVGFLVLRFAYGVLSAFFGSVIWLASMFPILGGGNYTEEFALPLQFSCLFLFQRAESRGRYGWRGFVIGAMSATTFILRPNLVGVGTAIIIYLLLSRALQRQWRVLLRDLSLIFLGAACMLLFATIPFAHTNSLDAAWDAVFRYSLAFSTTTAENRIETLITGLYVLWPAWISALAIGSWFIAGLQLLPGRTGNRQSSPTLVLSIILLPIELGLSSISGRLHLHYFIAWMPVLALLTGHSAYVVLKGAANRNWTLRIAGVPLMSLFPYAFLILAASLPIRARFHELAATESQKKGLPAVEYITASTSNNDYVLVWGAEAGINFSSRRQSPTRFVYQYPLYTRGYQSVHMIEEFLDDIRTNEPALIVDTSQ